MELALLDLVQASSAVEAIFATAAKTAGVVMHVARTLLDG